MKKIFALAGLLLAFGMGSAFAKKASNENKIKVVTTIFPEYDWAREVIGEKADDVELTLLLNNGVDLHSYQPSVKDIAKIQDADIFVYVGGESDEWVDDVLKNVKKPNQKLLFALEYDKSWQITVDGEPVEMQRAMKDVFAIDVAEGEHEIRLKYVPRGWYAGVAMSAIGVATAVVWYLVDRKKSKK